MLPPSESCPLAPCLRMLAGAWTLEILFHLRQGPLRYGELRRALAGVSSKVLAARLKELVERGVLHRNVLPANPPMVEYSLTEVGQALQPVLDSISQVSERLRAEYGVG